METDFNQFLNGSEVMTPIIQNVTDTNGTILWNVINPGLPTHVYGIDILVVIGIIQTMFIILIAWYEMRRYKHALTKGGD